jgi:hypothetical protein
MSRGGFDLLKRVDNRFPEAPEVRAAYATFLAVTGEQIAAQRKYLEIPDVQRLKYINDDYLEECHRMATRCYRGLGKGHVGCGEAQVKLACNVYRPD